MSGFESWGKQPKVKQKEIFLRWRKQDFPTLETQHGLPVGLGRSYGDVCLNDNGTVIHTSDLNRLIGFDAESGVLKCEAGCSLASILEFAIPRGWFLPVTPGTKFITIAGAIANDVHGKNHHRAGTFGRYVKRFELIRSDGRRLICSPEENPELYSATIGGLGLTGIIAWAEVALKRIRSSLIDLESTQFGSLDEFFQLSEASQDKFEYTVAWLDCLAGAKGFGRGIFMAGNHSAVPGLSVKKGLKLTIPCDLPSGLINKFTATAFNSVYYHKQYVKRIEKVVNYDGFFYPLDAINSWNRIYGPRGFYQFQCVLPNDHIKELLKMIVASGAGSFLAVLKEFGQIKSPGMLSFPRPGVTLALDFPNHGSGTGRLMRQLDQFVFERGGAIYPAKDNFMTPESFKSYYPNWESFKQYIDPKLSSSLWRRVMG